MRRLPSPTSQCRRPRPASFFSGASRSQHERGAVYPLRTIHHIVCDVQGPVRSQNPLLTPRARHADVDETSFGGRRKRRRRVSVACGPPVRAASAGRACLLTCHPERAEFDAVRRCPPARVAGQRPRRGWPQPLRPDPETASVTTVFTTPPDSCAATPTPSTSHQPGILDGS